MSAAQTNNDGKYVPGLWRCPKCKLDLIATSLNVPSGTVSANNEPQQCPNACGPMWRVSERDERQEAQRAFNTLFEETQGLRAQIAQFVRLEGPVPRAAGDVLMERKRQIEQEGWDTSHDDSHRAGELALAGAMYATHAGLTLPISGNAPVDAPPPPFWPWDREWWKPKDQRRNLVRAAALILAEIERMDRNPLTQEEACIPQPKLH